MSYLKTLISQQYVFKTSMPPLSLYKCKIRKQMTLQKNNSLIHVKSSNITLQSEV